MGPRVALLKQDGNLGEEYGADPGSPRYQNRFSKPSGPFGVKLCGAG